MLDINDPAFAYFSWKFQIHFTFYSSPCFHTEVMGLLSECLKTKELHQLQQKSFAFIPMTLSHTAREAAKIYSGKLSSVILSLLTPEQFCRAWMGVSSEKLWKS